MNPRLGRREKRRSGRRGSRRGLSPVLTPRQLALLSWYDVHLATPGQTVADQMGGTAATLGSTGGSDANDPIWLAWSGIDYLYSPGVDGNGVTIPYSTKLNNELDIAAYVVCDNWADGKYKGIVQARNSTNPAFGFRVPGGGSLEFFWFNPGGSAAVITGAAVPFANGAGGWVRVTFQGNNAGSREVKFYTSTDPVTASSPTWTQLGTTSTGATSSIRDGDPTTLQVAGPIETANETFFGKIYKAVVRGTINGTVVYSFDASQFATGSSTTYADAVGSAGGTWTISRSSAGRKVSLVKRRGLLLLGTDDFWTIPSAGIPSVGTSAVGTVTVVGRAWPTPLTNGRWIDTRGSATETVAGVGIRQNGTAASLVGTIGDGTSTAATAAVSYTAGQIVVASLVVTATTINLRVNGTESATVARPAGSATGTTPIVGAATTAAASPFEGGSFVVLAANRAFTTAEIASVESYYQAGT